MAINSFKGTIKEGTSESGGFFKRGTTSDKDVINIPPTWVNQTQDPTFRGKFVTMLGHAVMPGGHSTPTQAKTPQESARNALGYEGVAVTMEYRVARELGVPMWSDCDGTLKSA